LISFTIIVHPTTRPATPTVPDKRAKRAMAVNPIRGAEIEKTDPGIEISAAAANAPSDS
jgi:hypothetical protein